MESTFRNRKIAPSRRGFDLRILSHALTSRGIGRYRSTDLGGGLYACSDRDADPRSVGRVCGVEPTGRGLAARRWIGCGSRAVAGRQDPMSESHWGAIARQPFADAGDPRRHDRLHAHAGLGAALNRPVRFRCVFSRRIDAAALRVLRSDRGREGVPPIGHSGGALSGRSGSGRCTRTSRITRCASV